MSNKLIDDTKTYIEGMEAEPGLSGKMKLTKSVKIRKQVGKGKKIAIHFDANSFWRKVEPAPGWVQVEGLYKIEDWWLKSTMHADSGIPTKIRDVMPHLSLINKVNKAQNVGVLQPHERIQYLRWVSIVDRYEAFLNVGDGKVKYCKMVHWLEEFLQEMGDESKLDVPIIAGLKQHNIFSVEDFVFTVVPHEQDPKYNPKAINVGGGVEGLQEAINTAGYWLKEKQKDIIIEQLEDDIEPADELEKAKWFNRKLQNELAQKDTTIKQLTGGKEVPISREDSEILNHASKVQMDSIEVNPAFKNSSNAAALENTASSKVRKTVKTSQSQSNEVTSD